MDILKCCQCKDTFLIPRYVLTVTLFLHILRYVGSQIIVLSNLSFLLPIQEKLVIHETRIKHQYICYISLQTTV